MALNGVIGNALSGLQAAQIGLRTASNNVANVNTPGYARTELVQTARNSAGTGMGVQINGVRRVSDIFLQAASLRAASDEASASAVAASLDRLQAQFGAPGDEGSLFGRLNRAFDSLSAAAADSVERVARLGAASDLQSFFDEASRLSGEIRSMRDEADSRIGQGVTRANEILAELQELNSQAQGQTASGGDATGTANRQAELLDELATLVDVKTERQADGRLFVRTGDGVALLDNARLVLSYVPAGTGAYGVDYGQITATVSASGATADLTPSLQSGEIRGLINLRDSELPEIAAALSELAAGAADALNAAHNDAAAYPAPNTLVGRNTGLIGTDVVQGSGLANVAIVAADGSLVNSVQIGANPTGLSVNGVTVGSVAAFAAALDAAFGADATVSFANGQLTIDATNAAHGVATVQDATTPSSIGGRGIAHFFGLNDLVDSVRPGFFQTGLTTASAHGLAAGGAIGFKVTTADGRVAAELSVGVAGTSIADQLAALNDVTTGLGRFGSFALDSNGELGFTPAAGYERFEIAVTSDTTQRTGTGYSFTQIFGLGQAARLVRAEGFSVDPDIQSDSGRLALSKLEVAGAVAGDLVLAQGDNRGGQGLVSALDAKRLFSRAGALAGGQASLAEYAARLAGDVGSRSARAERAESSAQSLKEAADLKRSDVEGVSLDEELALMTLYQQAYNASARLLQAAKEMTDTLLRM